MKKLLFILVAMLVTMLSVSAFAYTPPAPPANGGYVVDQAGKLSPSQIQQLNQKIDRISKSTKNEFGILLLQDMGGENIEDVANATYKGWGVGKRGLDNGCLIVVAIKERKSRIETGKGVEGEVPDLKASDILRNNLNPHLKNGDFYGGFDDTLSALSAQMESRQGQKSDPPKTSSPSCDVSGVGSSTGDGGFLFVALAAGAVVLFLVVRALKRSRQEAERLEQEREDLAAQTERFLREESLKRQKAEEVAAARHRAEEAAAEAARTKVLSIPTPVVPVPEVPVRQSVVPQFKPVVSVPRVTPPANLSPRPGPITSGGVPVTSSVAKRAIATTAPVAVAAATNLTLQKEEERRRRERREEEERAEARRRREEEDRAEARRRREREEDDRRRREEDDRRSSSSSSSSFDWGSSSGGSDSGFGGFGGGDSGGGGSSSDW